MDGSPYSVQPDDTTVARLQALGPKLAGLEERCLVVRKAIAQHLAGSLNRASRAQEIYESNAIEGKLATLEETFGILNDRHLFDADAAIARYTLHESLTDDPKVQDVVGLAAARILVDQYIQEPDRPLAEADVRDMHGLILAGHHSAGRYKVHLNSIEGSTHVPPTPPVDVPGAMNMLVEWFRYSDAPRLSGAPPSHTPGSLIFIPSTTEMGESRDCWRTTPSDLVRTLRLLLSPPRIAASTFQRYRQATTPATSSL